MKKIKLSVVVLGLIMGLAGCGSSNNTEEKSVSPSSVEKTTEETVDNENQKMAEDLEEKAVEINQYSEIL
ncbi:hypothetical protein IGJ02_000042 [Enterococcus sp. DIV0724b]|uniref:hypothetical protein n=1 Tax=Enterococcus sp. DIV0724b TaxID=2774694 RepID=UPI003D2FA21B